jgi:RNA polymerase sigma-70 factor (ECF subfamily)
VFKGEPILIEKRVQEDNDLAIQAKVDQEAFAALYDRYFRPVYNYVRFRVHSTHLTDDITSQVFENAWRNLASFQVQRGDFRPWLFSIAHSIVVDYYQKRKKSEWVALSAIGELASANSDPEEILMNLEVQQELLNALKNLTDRERNIIALKFCSKLTNRQIAKLTGLKESNVGVILYRAMRRLKIYLTEERKRFTI